MGKIISKKLEDAKDNTRKTTLVRPHKQLVDLKQEETKLEGEEKCLYDVKRLVDAYPLIPEQDKDTKINVDQILQFRSYIRKLPIFIKLIDFADHK